MNVCDFSITCRRKREGITDNCPIDRSYCDIIAGYCWWSTAMVYDGDALPSPGERYREAFECLGVGCG
jgi:hypothetical protein